MNTPRCRGLICSDNSFPPATSAALIDPVGRRGLLIHSGLNQREPEPTYPCIRTQWLPKGIHVKGSIIVSRL